MCKTNVSGCVLLNIAVGRVRGQFGGYGHLFPFALPRMQMTCVPPATIMQLVEICASAVFSARAIVDGDRSRSVLAAGSLALALLTDHHLTALPVGDVM